MIIKLQWVVKINIDHKISYNKSKLSYYYRQYLKNIQYEILNSDYVLLDDVRSSILRPKSTKYLDNHKMNLFE